MNKHYKTPKGTDLPILDLRGKDYLEVKYRLVWFREEHPSWSIETDFVSVTDKAACAKATIKNDEGKVLSTSHKFETERGFPDFIEKAETGAIGRALALVGFGTQFCADEFDEGDRIVDSPVQSSPGPGLRVDLDTEGEVSTVQERMGDFQILFGKKYKGKRLKDIERKEIESYISWLESEAEKKKVPLSHEVKILKRAVELYYREDGVNAAEAS